MLTKNINFKNFLTKSNPLIVKKNFKSLLIQNLKMMKSLKISYEYSYKKN